MLRGRDEQDLMQMLHGQDEEKRRTALAELFRRFETRGRFVAGRFVNQDQIDDILQESFLVIDKALSRGHGPKETFSSYYFVTIRNQALRVITNGKKVLPVTEDFLVELDTPQSTDEDNEEYMLMVKEAYEQLSDRQQKLIWQREVEGISVQDIAEATGNKPNTVSAAVMRARNTLRKSFITAYASQSAQNAECQKVAKKLDRYVAGTLTEQSTKSLERHIESCERCAECLREVQRLGIPVRSALIPGFLAIPVAMYLQGIHNHRDEIAVAVLAATTVGPAAAGVSKAFVGLLTLGAAVTVGGTGYWMLTSQPPGEKTISTAQQLTQADDDGILTTLSSNPSGEENYPGDYFSSSDVPTPPHVNGEADPEENQEGETTEDSPEPQEAEVVPDEKYPEQENDDATTPTLIVSRPIDNLGFQLGDPVLDGLAWYAVEIPEQYVTDPTIVIENGADLHLDTSMNSQWECEDDSGDVACTPTTDQHARNLIFSAPKFSTSTQIEVTINSAERAYDTAIEGAKQGQKRGVRVAFNGAYSAHTYGANLMTCETADPECVKVQSGLASIMANDLPQTRAAVSNSVIDLSDLAGMNVEWAGLYWGATIEGSSPKYASASNPDQIGSATLIGPAGQNVSVEAENVWHTTDPTLGDIYQSFTDVTDLFQTQQYAGQWALSGAQMAEGKNRFAGWSLIVVVSDSNAESAIVIYDGLDRVGEGDNLILDQGYVHTMDRVQVSSVLYESDAQLVGDHLNMCGQLISDQNLAKSMYTPATRVQHYGIGFDAYTIHQKIHGCWRPFIEYRTYNDIYFVGPMVVQRQ